MRFTMALFSSVSSETTNAPVLIRQWVPHVTSRNSPMSSVTPVRNPPSAAWAGTSNPSTVFRHRHGISSFRPLMLSKSSLLSTTASRVPCLPDKVTRGESRGLSSRPHKSSLLLAANSAPDGTRESALNSFGLRVPHVQQQRGVLRLEPVG